MTDKPAVLGGEPVFPEPLPFARPSLEEPDKVVELVREALESGMLTNAKLVAQLEERVADYFGVRNCVAVSSCTIGLMLTVQALSDGGPVAVPSFTFSATAHAVEWNHLPIRFTDCAPDTWLVRPEDLPEDVSLIMATHVSGVPCDVEGLERRAQEIGAKLIFDAAHGAGSTVTVGDAVVPLGRFGDAEVFSLTPTKVLSGAEGGLVTTDDDELAARIRLARDYGNPGDYDTRFAGLNARLSELHAAVVLVALGHLEDRVQRRTRLAERYRERLGEIPGVGWQAVPEGSRSSYKDFIITIDADRFGAHRDRVVPALHAEGVPTRPYYAPPVHRQQAYAHVETGELPVTEWLAGRVIALPIWSDMTLDEVDGVAEALTRIHAHADSL
ncbi:MAG TPA: DegT/DnrJ/EryC1/StrS family aminotransferase [Acidimicrobiia bacterium]|nr:DegT/DnrJ/EryC1/StrS family aminotransferase [Acidimicrobiia bacterium]